MYKKIISGLAIAFVALVSKQINGQCGLGPNFTGTAAPTTGTTFVTLANFSPGTYFTMPVLNGGSYAISTCGAPFDSQISAWTLANVNVIYNDDNGPLCGGVAASVDNYIPNFTNFMNVQISQYYCIPGGSSSISVFIRQNNNLVFTSASSAMCSGQTRNLTATPANVGASPGGFGNPGTFSGTGVSGNVFTAPVVLTPTNYTITYTFGYVSQTQVITVNPLPVVTASASNSVICNGANTTLNGGGANTYTWTGGAVNAVPFAPALTATYNVTGTSLAGCTSTNVAAVVVTVNPLPIVSGLASSSVICQGGLTTLTGAGAVTYTWTGGATNAVAFSPANTATYNLTGTSGAGCTSTNVAAVVVTVNPLPVVTTSVTNSVICFGNTITLNGGGASTYTWSGGVTNGVAFAPASSGSYTVTGTAALTGCTNTAVRSITVNPLPVVTAAITNSVVCFGTTVSVNGGGANTYTWTGGVNNGVSFTPSTNASYSVTGTNSLTGCTSTNVAVASVTVNAIPIITGTASNSVICNGSTVALNGAGAATYTWTGGVSNGVAFSPSATASYSLIGTSTAGCTSTNVAVTSVTVNALPIVTTSITNAVICIGGTTALNAGGANTYTWTGSVTNGTAFSPTVTSSYSVTGTNSLTGCTSTNVAVASITVNALPILQVTVTKTVICKGDSTVLKANGANTFNWTGGVINNISFAPSATSSYSVTGTNTLTGCTSTVTAITVTVNPLPTVSLVSNNGTMCVGETVTLTASGASTYSWNTTATSTVLVVSPTSNTNYTVTGKDVNGCVNTSTITQDVSQCTGIGNLASNISNLILNVYPNPNNGEFTINYKLDIELSIVNELGQIVRTVSLNSTNRYEVNIANLSNGIYFVTGQSNGQVIKQKIIVAK